MDLTAGIVRILRLDGSTSGTGFVVSDDGLIVTCSHVLQDCKSQERGEPLPDKVVIVFYANGQKSEANVETEWYRGCDTSDIAFLRVQEKLPTGVKYLPLGASISRSGHSFKTFGFPDAKPIEGMWGYGLIGDQMRDESGNPSLQLTDTAEVSPGFSGAPVVDNLTERVVGMVNTITIPDRYGRLTETVFITPSESIRDLCSVLSISEICPYLGLNAFTENEAMFFYGRESFTDKLVQKLKNEPRFLSVLGASGSGKSSVVKAGLIPSLRLGKIPGSDTWKFIVSRPADDPYKQLSAQGLICASGGISASVNNMLLQHPEYERLILVIDQFEELLVSTPKLVAQSFISEVTGLLDSSLSITVILTMRDEFYGQLTRQATALLEWLERGIVNIPPTLSRDDLASIVKKPAEAVGLVIKSDLINTIVKDAMEATPIDRGGMTGRSGILPLVEFALTQLWERSQNGELTFQAYENIGGVTGGLTRWADREIHQLDPELRPVALRILTNLVNLGDEHQGLPDTRRRRSIDSLSRSEDEREIVEHIVKQFSDARLLVTARDRETDKEIVEIVHDALIHEWALLRRRLSEDREFLLWRQRLLIDEAEWERTGQDQGTLLHGTLLTEAERWLSERFQDLSTLECEYIQSSISLRDEEQASRNRLRRRALLILVGGLIVALLLAGLSGQQWWRAEKQSLKVEQQFGEQFVSQGDRAAFDKRWRDAESYYRRAREIFIKVGVPTFPADLGLWHVYRNSPPPVMTFGTNEYGASVSAISPDGRLVITGGKTTLKLWELETGREIQTFFGHSDWVTCITFSNDGRLVISGSQDKTIKVWDVATGKLLRTLTGHNTRITSLAISREGRYVLSSAKHDRNIRKWEIDTGRLVYSFHDDENEFNKNEYISSIDVSSDDGLIISGGNKITLWDTSSGKAVREFSYGAKSGRIFSGIARPTRSVTFSHDDQFAVSGGADAIIRLWNVNTGKLVRTFVGHSADITSVVFSPDGNYVLSGSFDKTIRLWDVKTGLELRRYEGDQKISAVSFSPDNRFALATEADIKIPEIFGLHITTGMQTKLWHVQSEHEVLVFPSKREEIKSIALSPDGRLAVSGDAREPYSSEKKHPASIWDVATGLEFYDLPTFSSQVLSIALSPDSRHGVFGTKQGSIILWDIEMGKQIHSFNGHTGPITSVAYSPNGRYVLSGSTDQTIKLWDVGDKDEIRSFNGHTGPITSVAYSANGRYFLSGSTDQTVRLWDVEDKDEIRSFNGHTGSIISVAYSPNGRHILSGSTDQTLKLWDSETGTELHSFTRRTSQLNKVGFLSEGQFAFSAGSIGSRDQTKAILTFWDTATGREIRSFVESTMSSFHSAIFSSDNLTALTLSNKSDKSTINAWDFSRYTHLLQLQESLPLAINTLQEKPDDGDSLKILGEWYALRGISDWSIKYLESADSVGAKNISHTTLAQLYWRTGRLDDARDQFFTAEKQGGLTSFYKSLYMKGITFSYMKRGLEHYGSRNDNIYRNTIVDLTKAIELAPRKDEAYLSRAYHRRGNAFLNLEKWDKAIADLTTAIKLDPNDSDSFSDRGLVYRYKHKYELSIKDLTKAIEINKNADRNKFNFRNELASRGYVFLDFKKWDEAIADFTRAIALEPKFSSTSYIGRAIANWNKGQVGYVIADLTKAIELSPKNDKAYIYRGTVFEQTEELDRAIDDYSKVINLSPDEKVGYHYRGRIRQEKGDLFGAIKDYTRVIELDPKDISAYLGRAFCFYEQDNWDKAIADYNKALKLDPKNTNAYYDQGRAYLEKKDYKSAIVNLTKAIEIEPTNIEFILGRAKVYFRQMNNETALVDINRLLQLEAREESDHYLIARAYSIRSTTYKDDLEGRRARKADTSNALEHLKIAIEAGNLDLENLKQQADLKALGPKKEYRKLENSLSFYRALRYLKAKHYRRAIAEFTEAINTNPKHEQAYLTRGSARESEEDWKGAIGDYTKALKLNPKNATTYNSRGLAYMQNGKIERAITDFNQAIQFHPVYASAYRNRGDVFLEKGNAEQAIVNYTKAIELDRGDFIAYRRRADALMSKKDWKSAISDYTKALELNPKNATTYNSRGLAYIQKGEIEHAIKDFNQAIRHDPQFAIAYKNRGDAFRRKNDFKRAVEDFDIVWELNPKDPDVAYLRGLTYQERDWQSYADENFSTAIQINPKNTKAYLARARTRESEKDWKSAISDYTKALKLNPKNAATYNSRGLAYMKKGGIEHAIRDFNQAIRHDPQFAIAYRNRGDAFKKKDKVQQAIMDYTKAIELAPSDFQAYLERGIIYFNKDNNKAVVDLSSAIRLDPKSAKPRYLRGAAYSAMGNFELAISDMTESMRLSPKDWRTYLLRASVYYDMRKYDQAIADYSEAIRLYPLPDVYLNRAYAYRRKGDLSQAIADFTKAILIDPNNAGAYLNRASTYFELSKDEHGLSDIVTALQFEAKNEGDHYNAACAYSLRSTTYKDTPEGRKARKVDISKALTHLKTAVEMGYASWQHLKEDPDLDALRFEQEYRELVKDR